MENTLSFLQLANLWIRGRVFRDRASKWDHQYASGRWDKLKIPAEYSRFDATAQLLVNHARPGAVLEVGCGEALLQQRLKPADYRSWVGIDISEVAIQRAQAFAGGWVRYHVADMELFDTGDRFDTIVFTESIYYSANPRRLLERYVRFLRPNGRFIVSIFRTKRSARIWEGLHEVAVPLDSLTTTNELGTWDCEVMIPLDVGSIPRESTPPIRNRQDARARRSLVSQLASLFVSSTPEGYEDESGFHVAPLRVRAVSGSRAPWAG